MKIVSVLGASAVLATAAVAVAGDHCLRIVHLGQGPGAQATDKRAPELGNDLHVLLGTRNSLATGIKKAQQTGPVIEAKFELDDQQKLSLSVYPAGKGLDVDAERNVFEELSGDPSVAPFAGSHEVFHDQEHLTRSSRDLTLVQLSKVDILTAVRAVAQTDGWPFWAIPTIRRGRAGWGVYSVDQNFQQRYSFVDGGGSDASNHACPQDLGTGPGAGATDQRTPELGSDLSILKQSKIKMSAALAQVEAKYGTAIEAKFELGDDGKLSLSIYPVGKGISTDAERNTFFEASGDPTAAPFAPTNVEFKAPDEEHLTRSARDLTIVQTASLSLREAVAIGESRIPGGMVFWAIPTIRDTRSGYGVYVQDAQGKVHYFFIS